MKNLWTRAALGVASLLCVGAANAFVIDFENIDTTNAPYAPLMATGDYVTQGGYYVNTQDANNAFGLIGQLSNGSDPASCLNGVCPTGNTTNFLTVYNDGIAHVGLLSGANVTFNSISAAYIGAPGAASTSTVYFVVEADRADGTYFANYYALSSTGAFRTITSTTARTGALTGSTGALSNTNFTDLFFYGYFCTTSCSAFATDQGQFAIDNITINTPPVPEPAEWMLMLAGLTAVAGFARRRRSV